MRDEAVVSLALCQAWRLHPSSPWPLERQTLRMGVPYFVDDSFELFHSDGARFAEIHRDPPRSAEIRRDSIRRDPPRELARALPLGRRDQSLETDSSAPPTGASLATAEGEVERQTLAKVRQRCRHERAQRQKMMEAAGHYQGQERTSMQEQAGRAHMRWCDELSRLEGLERSAGRR